MKHLIKRFFAATFSIGFGAIFGIASLIATSFLLEVKGWVQFGVALVASLLMGSLMWRANFARIRLMERIENLTYDVYIRNNPHQHRHGSVTCNRCGSHKISARGLMQHTYHREHFCTQCGTTLYYSPEGATHKR